MSLLGISHLHARRGASLDQLREDRSQCQLFVNQDGIKE